MIKTELSSHQKVLLKRYTDAGGVVEYVLFDCDPAAEPVEVEQTHRQAVIRGFEALQRKAEKSAADASLRLNMSRDQCFLLDIDNGLAERLMGKRISRAEFLGTRYDLRRNGLIVRGDEEPYWNQFFFYEDKVRGENSIRHDRVDNGLGTGYAYAFSDPPYGMRLSGKDKGRLFEAISADLLGGIDDASFIYEWPTDWSNYFEAGKEWWGSFLWSFANRGFPRITVITASTTD